MKHVIKILLLFACMQHSVAYAQLNKEAVDAFIQHVVKDKAAWKIRRAK